MAVVEEMELGVGVDGEMAEEAMLVAGGVGKASKGRAVAFRGSSVEEAAPAEEFAGSGVEEAAPEEEFAGSSVEEAAPAEEFAGGVEEAAPEEESSSRGVEMEAAARGGVDQGAVVAHNADMMHLIVSKASTRVQYRCSALAQEWRDFVSKPISLKYHLYPPPPIASGVLPFALVVQPKYLRLGFVHLIVFSLDPRRSFETNISVHARYQHCAEDPPSTYHWKVPPEARELVDFFEKTVPMLDICFVASHGSLLLGRSPTSIYICIPGTGRWIKLPPPPAPFGPDRDTAYGVSYILDDDKRSTEFLVVLLVRVRSRRLVALTFSSQWGHWMVKELGVHGAARCLGAASPGIHARNRVFWLSEKRPGRVVCYDVASGRVSVFREPPVASGRAFLFRKPSVSARRAERTLGSVHGRLRFCAVDIIQESNVQEIQGVFSVWLWHLDDEGSWGCVHKEDIHKEADEGASTWMYYYLFVDMKHKDSPVDFANASDAWLVLERMGILQKRDLTNGTRSYLTGLHGILEAGSRHHLYRFFDVFPLFM